MALAGLPAIYAPAAPAAQTELPDPPAGPQAAEETFARAVEHGDEHVIKFGDTAADVDTRTGNSGALAAAIRAAQLIGRSPTRSSWLAQPGQTGWAGHTPAGRRLSASSTASAGRSKSVTWPAW